MMYPKVQAVAAPTLDAEVMFDFNDEGLSWARGASSRATGGVLSEGYTLGSPERLSAPGDPRTSYGLRRPGFVLRLQGPRFAALAAQSRLARWLQQPEGWVMFQLEALASPVWLRMLGAYPSDLSFEQVYVDRPGPDTWQIGVSFDAAPWLYGKRIDLGTFNLSSDPAAGMWTAAPDVKGDAPARLRVTFDRISGAIEGEAESPSLSVGVTPAPPVTWQVGSGDGFTGYAGTTNEANAASSGGSRKRLDFTDPAMQVRFAGVAPPVDCGLYRVRVRGQNLSADKSVPTVLAINSTIGDTVAWPPASGPGWVDYGLYAIPTGLVDLPGVAGGSVTPYLDFSAGTAGLDAGDDLLVDAVLLEPVRMVNEHAEATMLNVGVTGYLTSLTLDGDREVPYAMRADGTLSAAQGSIDITGGWPELLPGVPCTVSAYRTDASDISDECTVSLSYHPRWLFLAEATP